MASLTDILPMYCPECGERGYYTYDVNRNVYIGADPESGEMYFSQASESISHIRCAECGKTVLDVVSTLLTDSQVDLLIHDSEEG